MTIRARVAFGLVCAEKACNQLGLSNDTVDRIFTHFWAYTSEDNLEWWDCKHSARAILSSADHLANFRESLFLYRVMRQLDEIGGGNLYGGFRNKFTLEPTLQLCRLVQSHQISLPPTHPFIQTSRRTFFGFPNLQLGWDINWGRTFDGNDLRNLVWDKSAETG